MSQERYITIPQIRTLANGERWSLRNGQWHMVEPYGVHYSPVSSEHFDGYARTIAASKRVKEVAH